MDHLVMMVVTRLSQGSDLVHIDNYMVNVKYDSESRSLVVTSPINVTLTHLFLLTNESIKTADDYTVYVRQYRLIDSAPSDPKKLLTYYINEYL